VKTRNRKTPLSTFPRPPGDFYVITSRNDHPVHFKSILFYSIPSYSILFYSIESHLFFFPYFLKPFSVLRSLSVWKVRCVYTQPDLIKTNYVSPEVQWWSFQGNFVCSCQFVSRIKPTSIFALFQSILWACPLQTNCITLCSTIILDCNKGPCVLESSVSSANGCPTYVPRNDLLIKVSLYTT
jgi:hypothetical protein